MAVIARGLRFIACLDEDSSVHAEATRAGWARPRCAARREVFRNPIVWLLGAAYFGMKLIRYCIEEAVRQAANFPTVLVREDWLLGVVAVQQVHQFLYSLFVEDNKPQPPTGPKQWSFKLSERHRRLLEALPVPQPERASVLEARQAALSALFQEAPLIAARNGVEYPHVLVDAVQSFLEEQGLGLGDPIGPRTAGEQ